MTFNYGVILFIAFISGFSTLLGVILALLVKHHRGMIVFGLSFAAGIMVLVSLAELLPAASGAIGWANAALALAIGAVVIAILDVYLPHTHAFHIASQKHRRLLAVAYLVAIGLILHDFPEGIAMANSFIISPRLGLTVALIIALHNIPEEFAVAMPAVAAGKRALLWKVAIASGLAEPAGAAVGLLLLGILPGFNPYIIAVAAGAMAYVSLHELLPLAARYRRWGFLLAGVASSVAAYYLLTAML